MDSLRANFPHHCSPLPLLARPPPSSAALRSMPTSVRRAGLVGSDKHATDFQHTPPQQPRAPLSDIPTHVRTFRDYRRRCPCNSPTTRGGGSRSSLELTTHQRRKAAHYWLHPPHSLAALPIRSRRAPADDRAPRGQTLSRLVYIICHYSHIRGSNAILCQVLPPRRSSSPSRRALAIRRSLLARAAARAAPPKLCGAPCAEYIGQPLPCGCPRYGSSRSPARTTAHAFLFGTGDIERLRRISFSAYNFRGCRKSFYAPRLSAFGMNRAEKGSACAPPFDLGLLGFASIGVHVCVPIFCDILRIVVDVNLQAGYGT